MTTSGIGWPRPTAPHPSSPAAQRQRRRLAAVPSGEVRALEQWFVQRGAPTLVEGYGQRIDLARRARPFLLVAIVVEVVVGVGDLDFAWWQNVLAILGAFAVLGLGALLRRPAPQLAALVQRTRLRVLPEVAAFVVLPPLLTATVGSQPGQALLFAAGNIAIAALAYLAASFGLVPVLRWAGGKSARELGAVARLVARALPLLLLIQIVLFINTEMWQVADGLDGLTLGIVVLLFLGTGTLFLVTRLPRELDELATFTGDEDVESFAAGTPAAALAGELDGLGVGPMELSRSQRLNVSLVALFSQGLQIALVTVLVSAFFVVFGLLTITPGILESWLGHAGDELFAVGLGGRDLRATAELLKLSAFLGAFSGLYFTVVLVTDETYRSEFRKDILDELRQTFAVRVVYLRLRERPAAPDLA